MIGWLATFLSIVGVVLNANKRAVCWPVWCVADLLWIGISIACHQPYSVAMWSFFFCFNLYGWRKWSKV